MRMTSCRRPWLKPWFACGFSLCVLGQVWHGEEALAQQKQQQQQQQKQQKQQQDQYVVESPDLSADSRTLTISKSEDGSGDLEIHSSAANASGRVRSNQVRVIPVDPADSPTLTIFKSADGTGTFHVHPSGDPAANQSGAHTGILVVDGMMQNQGFAGQPVWQPMTANLTDEYQVVRLWPCSDDYDAIRKSLGKRVGNLKFSETPLADVLAEISDQSHVKLTIDYKALEEAGIDLEIPITADLSGLTFNAALRSILGQIDLGFCFKDEQFLVTTKEDADRNLEKVLYPVVAGFSAGTLAAVIQDTIAAGNWEKNGGDGRIAPLPDGMGSGLIVSQTAKTHEEIEGFLRNLDKAFWTAPDEEAKEDFGFIRAYQIEEGSPLSRQVQMPGPDGDPTLGNSEKIFVAICNHSLPRGAGTDPTARAIPTSRSRLIVMSKSRAFHIMAAQLISEFNRKPPTVGISGVHTGGFGLGPDGRLIPDAAPTTPETGVE